MSPTLAGAGALLVVAAIAKAIEARPFRRHLYAYRLLPDSLLDAATVALVGAEAALGTALVVQIRAAARPAAGLLIAFTVLTIWARLTGRTKDCGCYGSWFRMPLLLGIGLNLLLAGLLWQLPAASVSALASLSAAVAGLFASALAWQRLGRLDSPLQPGQAWKSRWLPTRPELAHERRRLIAFLEPGGDASHRLPPLLDVLHVAADPLVLGVLPLSRAEADRWQVGSGARFPVEPLRPWSFDRLAPQPPLLVLIEGGRVIGRWRELPEPWASRGRAFFESIAPAPAVNQWAG